jgi:hypothetical protein
MGSSWKGAFAESKFWQNIRCYGTVLKLGLHEQDRLAGFGARVLVCEAELGTVSWHCH